jgi:hypothetical protein
LRYAPVRCISTVRRVRNRASAISRLLSPSAAVVATRLASELLRPSATEQAILPTMLGEDAGFAAAREGLTEQYPRRWKNVTHVEDWEKARAPDMWRNQLTEKQTWHHEPDVETMTLVPMKLQANIPHEGGASAARAGAGPQTETVLSTHPL